MKKFAKILVILILVLSVIYFVFDLKPGIHHSKPTSKPEEIVASNDKVLNAISKAENFLKTYQEKDGFFEKGLLAPKPALTCLVTDAFLHSPNNYTKDHPVIDKALKAILSCENETGGFYNLKILSMANYCTNLAMMVLHKADPILYESKIKKAAEFVKKSQLTGQEYGGGFGYDQGSKKADMSNTAATLESLHSIGELDQKTKENAIKFIEQCQNNSETNKHAWASNDKGFIYRPANSKAGSYFENGQERFKSYGLMTYAGILSMIFADLKKDDPRVKGAMGWVEENFSLDNNVNLGKKGLYYYYVMMAKSLDAYGEEKIITKDGRIHYWAKELADKIIKLQNEDGSFSNKDEQDWLEGDHVLVTSYMLKTLSVCYKNIPKSQEENKANTSSQND